MREKILELRPHFYALICVIGQWPEIQIDIVNRIKLLHLQNLETQKIEVLFYTDIISAVASK